MGRLFSVLLIVILMLSHGTMSAAAPHMEATLQHAGLADHDADHHDVQISGGDHASVMAENSNTDGKAQPGAGHHVHMVANSVPPVEIAVPNHASESDREQPSDEFALLSAAVAPLLEPPAL